MATQNNLEQLKHEVMSELKNSLLTNPVMALDKLAAEVIIRSFREAAPEVSDASFGKIFEKLAVILGSYATSAGLADTAAASPIQVIAETFISSAAMLQED